MPSGPFRSWVLRILPIKVTWPDCTALQPSLLIFFTPKNVHNLHAITSMNIFFIKKVNPNPVTVVQRFGIFQKWNSEVLLFSFGKLLDWKYYRSDSLHVINGISVPRRFGIGRRVGSNPRALSRKVAGLKPLLFLYCLFQTFFLVNFSQIKRIAIR